MATISPAVDFVHLPALQPFVQEHLGDLLIVQLALTVDTGHRLCPAQRPLRQPAHDDLALIVVVAQVRDKSCGGASGSTCGPGR